MHNHQTNWITQWGGICQGRHDSLIPPGYFYDTENYCLNPDGTLGPRPGLEVLATCPDGFPPIKVFTGDWDGTPIMLVSTKKHVYKFNKANNSLTLIYTWSSTCKRASFALINPNTNPHIVMGNGIDAMAVYDGTTAEELTETNAPKGLPIEYKNYVAVFGIPDHPGRVQFNVKNGYIKRYFETVENYLIHKIDGYYLLPDDFYEIISVKLSIDSQEITNYTIEDNKLYLNSSGQLTQIYITYTSISEDPWLYGGILRTLELQGEVSALCAYNGLMIFTDRRTELFIGDPDEAQGQQVLSNTIGCANPDSVCEAEGSVYWIAQQGICRWDGGGAFPAEIISDAGAERPSNISEDMRKINWQNRQKFSCCYDYINRRIYFFIEHYKKIPEKVLTQSVFDFELRTASWFRWTFDEDFGINKIYFCNVPTELGETTQLDGRLILSGNSDKVMLINFDIYHEQFKDLDEDYEFFIKSGAMDMGTTEYDKIFRAVTLKILPNYKNYNGAQEIDLYGYADNQPTEQKARFRASFNFIMGVSVMGDRLTMMYATEQRRPIAFKSKYFAFELRGKGPGNALPICALGISFRGYSNRSTLTWDNDLI